MGALYTRTRHSHTKKYNTFCTLFTSIANECSGFLFAFSEEKKTRRIIQWNWKKEKMNPMADQCEYRVLYPCKPIYCVNWTEKRRRANNNTLWVEWVFHETQKFCHISIIIKTSHIHTLRPSIPNYRNYQIAHTFNGSIS